MHMPADSCEELVDNSIHRVMSIMGFNRMANEGQDMHFLLTINVLGHVASPHMHMTSKTGITTTWGTFTDLTT